MEDEYTFRKIIKLSKVLIMIGLALWQLVSGGGKVLNYEYEPWKYAK